MEQEAEIIEMNAIPEIPEFLATLKDEHRYFQSLLDIAREQQALLAQGGDVDLDVLQELLQYLAEYPEDVHHPREEMLFKRLRRVDPDSSDTVEKLHAGHEDIHKESNRLHYMVMRANNGEKIQHAPLARQIERFVKHYEKHMRDEDEIVFTRALQALTVDDWELLQEGWEDVDDPLFGTRVRRRYRRLANVLREKLGVVKQDLVVAEYLSLGALIDAFLTVSETGINLVYVVVDRSSETLRQNLTLTRESIGSGKFVEIVKLPSRLSGNIVKGTRQGFRESKDLMRKAFEHIRTPYAMRMDTLKDILREDWNR